jgi:hypothetical protein
MTEVAAALHDTYLLLDQVEAHCPPRWRAHAADAIVDPQARRSCRAPVASTREDALARLDAFKGQLPGCSPTGYG